MSLFTIAAIGGIAAMSAAVLTDSSTSLHARRRAPQPRAFGFGGVHHPAGQAHFHRLSSADRAGQPLRPAHARRAELRFRGQELRLIRRDDERPSSQVAPAAEREAVDRGDPRFSRTFSRSRSSISRRSLQGRNRRRACRPFPDVGARGKRLVACAGEHRAALAQVGFNAANAAIRSSSTLELSAFSACGRLSVTSVTAPRV